MGKYFTELSKNVLGAAIEVHKTLGPGLLESTYQQFLAHEIHLNNIGFKKELRIPVSYKGINISYGYRIDFLIENKLIIELKSVESILGVHEAQLLTYIKLTSIKHGFLINFNVKLLKDGIKSFVM